jgi:hypothetical protein
MPRYLVERTLPAGLDAALAEDGMSRIVAANRYAEVAWLHSYVTEDTKVMVCLYEADSPEAIRKAARRAGLPITVIHRVSVLDPHGFKVPGTSSGSNDALRARLRT